MGERRKRVLWNTATSYARFGVTLAVMFVLTPFLIEKLGKADYGLWTLVFSVLGFFGLLDFGFGTGVVKFVAEAQGRGDVARRNRAVSTLAAVYLALAGLGLVGLAGLSFGFNALFAVPPAQQEKALALLWLLGVRSVLLGLPLGLFRSLLFGEQRIGLINAVQAGTSLVYAATVLLVLSRAGDVVTLAWLNLGAMLVEHVLYVALAYRALPQLHVQPRLIDRALLREAASFSAATFVVSVAALILLRTDPIVVKAALPFTAVAVYGVALKVAENAHLLTKQFVNVLSPLAAELHGAGEAVKLRFVLVNAAKFALLPGTLLAAAILALGTDALVLWVGPDFAEGGPVLSILMLAMATTIPQMVASNVLVMTGAHGYLARAAIVGVLLNLALSLTLVWPFGLLGVALGTLGASVVVDVLLVPRRACQRHGVAYGAYLRRVFVPALAGGLLQYGITLGLRIAIPPPNLWVLALEAIPGACVNLALFWGLFVEPSEKQLLLRRRRPAAPPPPPGGEA